MKGQKKVEVAGKELTLVFNWAAVEDFCDEHDLTFTQFDKEVMKPKKLRSLIYYMAKEGGSDVELDDLRQMSFNDVQSVMSLIEESSAGEDVTEKKPKKK